jgi:hypothetical protein
MSPSADTLSILGIGREMWSVYRRHWAFLVPAAIVVLLPQSIADTLAEGGLSVEHAKSVAELATLGGALVLVAVNLFGQSVYAGLAAAAVVDWRAGLPLPKLSALLRAMPIGRLIVLDLVVTFGIALGFVLLLVPGLIVITYLGISPAVLKLEHLGIRAALIRSVELVSGHAWRVFAILVMAIGFSELAVQAVTEPFTGAVALTIANIVAQGIFQPIEGLAIALVAIHLLELRGEAAEPDQMARSLVGESGQ